MPKVDQRGNMPEDFVGVDCRLLIGYLKLHLATEMLKMSPIQTYRITKNANITNHYCKKSMLYSFINSTNSGYHS